MQDKDRSWFEMHDLRRPSLSRATWIPLRSIETHRSYSRPTSGGWEEHIQVIGIELPREAADSFHELDWVVAQSYDSSPRLNDDGSWTSAGAFNDPRFEFSGRYPVLVVRHGNEEQWLLDQDLVLALGLIHEDDNWVRPEEDFIKVAQMENTDFSTRLTIRAEQLRDYLGARDSGLLLSTYRSRKAFFSTKPDFGWDEEEFTTKFDESGEWRVSHHLISESGLPFGPWSVMHVSRSDPELDDEVPVLSSPDGENVLFEKGTLQPSGEPLSLVVSELWRNEWVEPSPRSPRVRHDRTESNVEFIVEADGTRALSKALLGDIRWLWFSPLVVGDVLEIRRGALWWATEDTGGLRLQSHGPLHFGVNANGCINVFAKDIGGLPEHVQRLWSARNIAPDGKVCEELIASQMEASPASTLAPEVELTNGTSHLATVFQDKFERPLFRAHSSESILARKIHRFRCCESDGAYALCKDLSRYFIERLDESSLSSLVTSKKKLRGLKLLEKLLIDKGADGRKIMGPLFACYDLRMADAHLPSSSVDECLHLLNASKSRNDVQRGKAILRSIANSIALIAATLENEVA